MAELVLRMSVSWLSSCAHEIPVGVLYESISELDNIEALGYEILKKHKVGDDLRQGFLYYIKLHRLYNLWDGTGDFDNFCNINGLK